MALSEFGKSPKNALSLDASVHVARPFLKLEHWLIARWKAEIQAYKETPD
jgi:hypothetical protein